MDRWLDIGFDADGLYRLELFRNPLVPGAVGHRPVGPIVGGGNPFLRRDRYQPNRWNGKSHPASLWIFAPWQPCNLASNLMAAGITKSYVPSGLAMGIAFIIPAYYSLVIFYGMVAWWVWTKIAPTSSDKFTFTVASGLIAGEGLMGIANAGLTSLGIG